MSKSTISTVELFEMFPDADMARKYMEKRRWPDGQVCPSCGEKDRIYNRGKGIYRCNACMLDRFSVRTGTIFERSKIGLHKWLYMMYLFVTARKGISSVQLAKQIGTTQKSAWFMLQRIREACGDDPTQLSGIIEMDESAIYNRLNSEKINKVLDTVSDAIFAYRPSDKGKSVETAKKRKKEDKSK